MATRTSTNTKRVTASPSTIVKSVRTKDNVIEYDDGVWHHLPCSFWMKGRCLKDDACWFPHDHKGYRSKQCEQVTTKPQNSHGGLGSQCCTSRVDISTIRDKTQPVLCEYHLGIRKKMEVRVCVGLPENGIDGCHRTTQMFAGCVFCPPCYLDKKDTIDAVLTSRSISTAYNDVDEEKEVDEEEYEGDEDDEEVNVEDTKASKETKNKGNDLSFVTSSFSSFSSSSSSSFSPSSSSLPLSLSSSSSTLSSLYRHIRLFHQQTF